MGSCCHEKGCALDALRESQGRILRIVLAINVMLFLIELTAGIRASSTSLMADSLDTQALRELQRQEASIPAE